ncbi:cytochrome c oxidase subunit 3 [Mongoliitalea daihaiensis]|uniref:cytochrome c oxidase subunit 3 n=1 Tax=Mongoliitalea daihaiensis TaxID=2782006 RepID=UPI001F1ABD11|nr:cytochrome c oxidase subunit 3 [Mongoliitalea daihaiensis]UJP65920.1 cytochrome c oxidase subunit 3 [Mongoliitalea daihaiensis]
MTKTTESWFRKIEKMHPYQTLMYLGMFGSGLIFLFMTTAFLASDTSMVEATKFRMPKSFILSTLVLLISGYTVSKLLLHYREDSVQKLKNSLLITFFLGVIFTVLQFIGWKELSLMGVDFRGLPSGSFLYVLSGIHIFHLIGAMIFALIMVYQYSRIEKDEIKNLVLLTNPFERMRIELFTIYWHFMDFIWLVLFMIFVFVF